MNETQNKLLKFSALCERIVQFGEFRKRFKSGFHSITDVERRSRHDAVCFTFYGENVYFPVQRKITTHQTHMYFLVAAEMLSTYKIINLILLDH